MNLEFAYQDTGDVTDLRLLPEHLGVGMGVADVRGETLQSVEEIARLAAAGAQIVGADRIALNPDCGFAPRRVTAPESVEICQISILPLRFEEKTMRLPSGEYAGWRSVLLPRASQRDSLALPFAFSNHSRRRV